MSYQDILYTKEEGIATITMNRPEKMNAFRPLTLEEMIEAIEDARNDDNIRVVVLTGAGRGFCSGGDLAEETFPHPEKEISGDVGYHGIVRRVYSALRDLDKPTIAAINGAAVAEGFTFALLCDFRIASEGAKIGDAGMRFAMPGDLGNLYLLPRIVGMEKAMEITFLGKMLDAAEAQRLGVIGRVVPYLELPKAVMELARELAKMPPIGIRLAKSIMYRLQNIELGAAWEDITIVRQVSLDTADVVEGFNAFVQRRPPVFKGR